MRFKLAKETRRTAFATRQAALQIRVRLSTELSSLKAGEALELDLAAVEAMTISYADELVAKLVAERKALGSADSFFLLLNASEEIAETIAVALERRGLIAAHRDSRGNYDLLAASPQLVETFDVARELEEFTASDLADELDLTLPAANNRIKALAEVGVVTRSRHAPSHGGRQYLYQAAA